MTNERLARYSFRFGDVFPDGDRMARYVMRLSMALGDLRIAVHYATRSRQNSAERLYFVRLSSAHLREIVILMDPPNRKIVPDVEEFLRSLPRGTKPSRAAIRKSHRKTHRLLDAPMAAGRPPITVDGKTRPPTLRDDLKELRNRFFHYGHDRPGDDALQVAMASRQDDQTGYVIRERTLRAEYADAAGATLAHPFDAAFAVDMHSRIVELMDPLSTFIHLVEAAWLHSRASDVTVRRKGHEPETLAAYLKR